MNINENLLTLTETREGLYRYTFNTSYYAKLKGNTITISSDFFAKNLELTSASNSRVYVEMRIKYAGEADKYVPLLNIKPSGNEKKEILISHNFENKEIEKIYYVVFLAQNPAKGSGEFKKIKAELGIEKTLYIPNQANVENKEFLIKVGEFKEIKSI